jgi:ABC-2 type transport system ATP-binding protein
MKGAALWLAAPFDSLMIYHRSNTMIQQQHMMRENPADIAIHTEDLGRDFAAVRALDHLTLDVPRGIVFGFLGPNGSGKTTTIRLLLGLLEPTTGRAQVLGLDTRTQAGDIRARSGALLEHSGLYERLSAEDNLDYYGRIWRMPSTERRTRIQELLTHFGLWERRKEVVKNWSRGMRQKLAIARAMFHRPELIFLDEPTAGLDPVAAVSLRQDIASLVAQSGVTVFLTTHNLVDAEKLCAQVAIIRAGKLLAVGNPAELRARGGQPRIDIYGRGFDDGVLAQLRARPEVTSVDQQNGYLSIALRDPQVETAPLVSLMVSVGAQVEEVRKSQASLEEVFLTLVEDSDSQQDNNEVSHEVGQ